MAVYNYEKNISVIFKVMKISEERLYRSDELSMFKSSCRHLVSMQVEGEKREDVND